MSNSSENKRRTRVSSAHLTMKLLIDGASEKVIFAEAGAEVVDSLFSLLGMPLSSIAKLHTKDCMVGIGRLYRSLEGLKKPYLQSKKRKAALLEPSGISTFLTSTLLPHAEPTRYYMCPNYDNYSDTSDCSCSSDSDNWKSDSECDQYVTDVRGTLCPSCKTRMTIEKKYVGPALAENTVDNGSYVKGVVTYTIMDDLTVIPTSRISTIKLLNKQKVKDLSSLQEKTVTFGIQEGFELLKASVESKTVLTDVFLHNTRPC